MAYETHSLGYALKQMDEGSPTFFIPAMQRPYVWAQDEAIKLLNSIYQGFPIGASLIWNTIYDNPDNLGAKRAYRFPHEQGVDSIVRSQAHLDAGHPITFVLDGQQRLTSLNIAVRGGWRKKNGELYKMYFNPTLDKKGAFLNLNSELDNIKGMILCSEILQWEDESVFEQQLMHPPLFVHGESELCANVRGENIRLLRKRFWEDSAFCCGVYNAKNMQSALDVFILANDTGKRLEKSDLLLATLTTSWNNLSADQVVDDLRTKLNKLFVGGLPFKARKPLLKSMLAVAPIRLPIAHNMSSITPEVIVDLESGWPAYSDSMIKTVELVTRWGLHRNRCLTSVNALIPLTCWIHRYKIDINAENNSSTQNLELARVWLISALMSSAFGGNSDSAISAARDVILDSETSKFPFQELHLTLDAHHNYNLLNRDGVTTFLSGLYYDSNGQRSLIRLVLTLVRGTINERANYELDHIFPKGVFEAILGRKVHAIFNIELLTESENKVKRNQSPATLWNNEMFSEEWREANQLPGDRLVNPETHQAIYDEPDRFYEVRLNNLVEAVCLKLDIEQGLPIVGREKMRLKNKK